MSTVIRPAEQRDVARILEIINYEITHSNSTHFHEKRTYSEQLSWFQEKQVEGFPVLVAEHEGEMVGYGTYRLFSAWDLYQHSIEHTIYLAKDSRGMGIGKLILQNLMNHAQEDDHHVMIAGIDPSNERAIRLHEQFGFELVGKFKEVGYKQGKWMDLVFMQKVLG